METRNKEFSYVSPQQRAARAGEGVNSDGEKLEMPSLSLHRQTTPEAPGWTWRACPRSAQNPGAREGAAETAA